MNKRKKASYGMEKKKRGGDYMEPNKELQFGGVADRSDKIKKRKEKKADRQDERMLNRIKRQSNRTDRQLNRSEAKTAGLKAKQKSQATGDSARETRIKTKTARRATKAMGDVDYSVKSSNVRNMPANKAKAAKAEAKGEKKLTNIKNRQANREARRNAKMEKGGPRKKAFLGAAKTIAGAVGKLAPEGSKLGNIANTVSGVLDNPLQAGINAIKGQPIAGGGQQQQPAATPAAAPAAAPQPAATGQPDQQQTMRKGGKKRKMMGGKKMKYKAGGVKPDYLDMDKDGNKTEPMKSALKDRRSKAKKGRYKAQEGTITPEGAKQKRYSYNKTKERQERNASQARTKRVKEIGKAALTGNVVSMAADAAKKMKKNK